MLSIRNICNGKWASVLRQNLLNHTVIGLLDALEFSEFLEDHLILASKWGFDSRQKQYKQMFTPEGSNNNLFPLKLSTVTVILQNHENQKNMIWQNPRLSLHIVDQFR